MYKTFGLVVLVLVLAVAVYLVTGFSPPDEYRLIDSVSEHRVTYQGRGGDIGGDTSVFISAEPVANEVYQVMKVAKAGFTWYTPCQLVRRDVASSPEGYKNEVRMVWLNYTTLKQTRSIVGKLSRKVAGEK